jgi:hypothetical protein
MGWRRGCSRKATRQFGEWKSRGREVDGEYVIWWCSRRTGNGSYDGVKPDKGNEEEKCTG